MNKRSSLPFSAKRSRRDATSALLLSLLAVASLSAQSEPAATPATADEAVTLSPFRVSTDKDVGYRASNSIAGTRSNTPIKEVPLNIQVFTKELTDDLFITNQVELERYNAALVNGSPDVHSDNPIQQSYNGFLFRGFIQNWGLRDGIREYDPIDTQGLARVEVVKGPAAALYGLAYPGGIMNNITKDVDFTRNFTSLRLTAQSEAEYRGTIDTNFSADAPGGGKFGIRFNGAAAETQDERDHSQGSVRYYQTAVSWAPLKGTELKLLVEHGYREKPNGLGYFSRGETDASGAALGNHADIPLQIFHPEISWTTNWSTGSNMRSAETNLYRGTINQAIGDNFNVTAYLQYSNRANIDSNGWDAQGSGGGASWDALSASGWIIDPVTKKETIRLGYHYRDWTNSMHAYGATGVYKFEVVDVKNTITFGANIWAERFLTHRSIQPADTTNVLVFDVRPGVDTTNFPIAPPPDYYADPVGGYGHEKNANDYYFASWQFSALNNRLRINAAVNHTNLKLVQYGSGVTTMPNTTKASKNSPMVGGMFDVTKEVSVFVVHSTSLFPTTDKNTFNVQLPPVVGTSNEAGVKIDLLEGKISGTISYYEIKQTGGSQRDNNAFNLNQQIWDGMSAAQRAVAFPGKTRGDLAGDLVSGGTQKSKGFEADIVFQPSRNWQFLLSYAHNNEKVTSAIDSSTIGQSTGGHIKDQLALLSKYTFTEGPVKGLAAGFGLQSSGKALQDYQTGIGRYSPSTFYAEAFAAYHVKVFGYNTLIQLNVKNLTKQDEFVGWKATGSSNTLATQRYRVPTVVRYSLTGGLDF